MMKALDFLFTFLSWTLIGIALNILLHYADLDFLGLVVCFVVGWGCGSDLYKKMKED